MKMTTFTITLILGLTLTWLIIYSLGICQLGPVRTVEVRVTGLPASTRHLVETDQGVFEVDNGFLLGVEDASSLYHQLQLKHRYAFVTKGNRVAGWFIREYPHVIQVVHPIRPPAPHPAPIPSPMVDLTQHDGQTIDFSSGQPVVTKISPADQAALDKTLKEMEEAAKTVTFQPTTTKP
jgi:hypothetical protein